MFHTPEKLDRFIRPADQPAFDSMQQLTDGRAGNDRPQQSSSTVAAISSDGLGDTASSAADLLGAVYFSNEQAPKFGMDSPSDGTFYGNPESQSNPAFTHKTALRELMGVPRDLFASPNVSIGKEGAPSPSSAVATYASSRGTSPQACSVPDSPSHHGYLPHSLRQSPLAKPQVPSTTSFSMFGGATLFPQNLRSASNIMPSFSLQSRDGAGPVMANSTPPTTPRRQRIPNTDDDRQRDVITSPPMRLGSFGQRRPGSQSPLGSSTPNQSPKPMHPSPAVLGTPRPLNGSPFTRLPPKSPFQTQASSLCTPGLAGASQIAPDYVSSYRTLDAPGLSDRPTDTSIAWGHCCQVVAVFGKSVFVWSPNKGEPIFQLLESPTAVTVVAAQGSRCHAGTKQKPTGDKQLAPANAEHQVGIVFRAPPPLPLPSPNPVGTSLPDNYPATSNSQSSYVAVGLASGLIHLYEFTGFANVTPMPPITECTSAITSLTFVQDVLYCGTLAGDTMAFRLNPTEGRRPELLWKKAAPLIQESSMDDHSIARRGITIGRLSPPSATSPTVLERRFTPTSMQEMGRFPLTGFPAAVPSYRLDFDEELAGGAQPSSISPRLEFGERHPDPIIALPINLAPPALASHSPPRVPPSPTIITSFAPPPQLPPSRPLQAPPVLPTARHIDPFHELCRSPPLIDDDSPVVTPISPTPIPIPIPIRREVIVDNAPAPSNAVLTISVSEDLNHIATASEMQIVVHTINNINTSAGVDKIRGAIPLRCAKSLSFCGSLLAFAAGAHGNILVARSLGGSTRFEKDVGCEVLAIQALASGFASSAQLSVACPAPDLIVSQGAAIAHSPATSFAHYPNSVVIYRLVGSGQLRPVAVLSGHTAPAIHMCLSPDESKLLTAAAVQDNTLRFWEVHRAQPKCLDEEEYQCQLR